MSSKILLGMVIVALGETRNDVNHPDMWHALLEGADWLEDRLVEMGILDFGFRKGEN